MSILTRVKCRLCKKKTARKELFKMIVNTAEGTHSMNVCPSCAEELNSMISLMEDDEQND